MMRWMAPRLPGPQMWVLHDGDPGILEHLDPGPIVDASGNPITVQTRVEQLADLRVDAFAGASLVTASALLDVLTRDEVSAIVDACVAADTPALFSLSVTGRVSLAPADDFDDELEAAFNDHQRRTVDGRRLLGPDAIAVVADMFAAAGWHMTTTGTPWRLGPERSGLIGEWLDGWLDAAVEQRPELGDRVAEFRQRRRAQVLDDGLRVVVHHEDLLAWPS